MQIKEAVIQSLTLKWINRKIFFFKDTNFSPVILFVLFLFVSLLSIQPIPNGIFQTLSLSLSLSHTHTHTRTHTKEKTFFIFCI